MNTWLENFIEQSDLNKYPISLRTDGGIGFKVGKDTVSNFVGHPVHYLESREMKPITLDWIPATGEFEGSWFGWDVIKKCPTYCGYELYTPKAILWNGIAYPLNFLRLENRMIADIPIGTYEIIYNEWGMNEVVTIPEPVEGTLEFDAPEKTGWDDYLYINPRRIVGGEQSGNVFALTKDMTYPVVIDPDYSGVTDDGYVYGRNATYATAQNTSYNFSTSAQFYYLGQALITGNYYVYRGFVKINTSGIPDTDIVSQANLKLVAISDSSGTDFDVAIKKFDWSAQDPLGVGSQEAAYDNCLSATADDNIWRNTSGISTNTQYTSGNLSTAWPSKTGYTYYGLISSRDVSATAPSGSEYIQIASQDNATSGYRPVLTVMHAAGGWANIGKINRVDTSTYSKINRVPIAEIGKVNRVPV